MNTVIVYILVCCCRRRSCATTHALVQNIVSFIFASVLIALNIVFIQRPYDCFFTADVCQRLSWSIDTTSVFECFANDTKEHCANTRLAMIKAQLAAGIIMVVVCLIYLILYVFVVLRASREGPHQKMAVTDAVMAPVHQPALSANMPYEYQYYAISPNLNEPSAPVMTPSDQPTSDYIASDTANTTYLPADQQTGIYPKV